MADVVDVAQAIVQKIAEISYPDGTQNPSVNGSPIIVYQGWPNESDLTRDLRAGKIHISVFPQANDRLFPVTIREWTEQVINVPSIVLKVESNSITVSGSVQASSGKQHIKIIVDNNVIDYVIKTTDTASTIANSLFALLSAYYGNVQLINNTFILPDNAKIVAARVGVTGTAKRLVRRQEKGFQITIWANCFDARDPIASIIDAALAGTDRLLLSDGSYGILRYRTSTQDDILQRQGAYRRDLFYAVEYGTYQTETQTQITSTEVNIFAGLNGLQETFIKKIVD